MGQNNFTLVKNELQGVTKTNSFALNFKNKYKLLSDIEEETIFIGDSLARDQEIHLVKKNNKAKRRVHCNPGIKTKRATADQQLQIRKQL